MVLPDGSEGRRVRKANSSPRTAVLGSASSRASSQNTCCHGGRPAGDGGAGGLLAPAMPAGATDAPVASMAGAPTGGSHSSRPWLPSLALKNSAPLTLVRSVGEDPTEPALMSL